MAKWASTTSANIKECVRSVFKRKRTAWNKRKEKTMTLDTQVNLAESDKGSFYNQRIMVREVRVWEGHVL